MSGSGQTLLKAQALLDQLQAEGELLREQWRFLLENRSQEIEEEVFRRARAVRDRVYGRRIFIRGLIEFTNYCRQNCYYCGIRGGNSRASRYRLTKEQILSCCEAGYGLGFRTFVLQGGEDPYFTDQRMVELICSIKERYPDCALTLSIGERPRESYAAFRKAGADRYLLRHETANMAHYAKLHPESQRLENRMECLKNLKELGFQTGAGCMVGSPGQTEDCLIDDLEYLTALQPEMAGIGPFIPHHDTPFKNEPSGSVELTLYLLGLVRLLLPAVLLPATTALGTAAKDGREMGVMAGANVVMPNLSPENVREKYLLYDNKIHTGMEAAECLEELRASMAAMGYEVAADRGDFRGNQEFR